MTTEESDIANVNLCKSENDALINLGKSLGVEAINKQLHKEKALYRFIKDDVEIKCVEQYQDRPNRISKSIDFESSESFILYFNHWKSESIIFGSIADRKFQAIIDYHNSKGFVPSWCSHKAYLTLEFSNSFEMWKNFSGTKMSQVDFSELIETNSLDILEPSGAELLEIARSLKGTKRTNFSQSFNSENGSHEFTYDEQIHGQPKKGEMELPEKIKLSIPIFKHSDPVVIEALFRFRITTEGLLLFYTLLNLPDIIDSEFLKYSQIISDKTKQKVLFGKA